MSSSLVPGTPCGLAWEKFWEDRAKNSEFLQPQAVLAELVGLRNSDMAFPEILIRDGQTRGRKIRNPFALVVGLNKVQLTFFLSPPCYFFPFSAGFAHPGSSRMGMQSCWRVVAVAAGFPDKPNLNLGVCGIWSNPDVLLALQTG